MPNRILREGIKSSGAVNALTDRAFRLYIHLISAADDFGLLEWNSMWLKTTAVPGLSWTPDEIERLMSEEIEGRGLVRTYEHNKKTYAAVEKWEQRRDAKYPKFPAPPWGFAEGSHLVQKEGGRFGGYVPKRVLDTPKPRSAPRRFNGAPRDDWRKSGEALMAKASELGVETRGETTENLVRLCEAKIQQQRRVAS